MFALIALMVLVIVACTSYVLFVGPRVARANAVAAGIHLGGAHAYQPRLVAAHRAERPVGAHRA